MNVEIGLISPHAKTSKRVVVHGNVKDAILRPNGWLALIFEDNTALMYSPSAVQYAKNISEDRENG